MKKKKFTVGMTFFVTPEMHEQIREVSDNAEISQSELIRAAVELQLAMTARENSEDLADLVGEVGHDGR